MNQLQFLYTKDFYKVIKTPGISINAFKYAIDISDDFTPKIIKQVYPFASNRYGDFHPMDTYVDDDSKILISFNLSDDNFGYNEIYFILLFYNIYNIDHIDGTSLSNLYLAGILGINLDWDQDNMVFRDPISNLKDPELLNQDHHLIMDLGLTTECELIPEGSQEVKHYASRDFPLIPYKIASEDSVLSKSSGKYELDNKISSPDPYSYYNVIKVSSSGIMEI